MTITVVDKNNIKVGDDVAVTVTLTGVGQGEKVTIEINGQPYESTTNAQGVASFTVPSITYGDKTVVASYGGNNKYVYNSTTANFTVSKRVSEVNVTAVGGNVGDNATVTVQVQSNATGWVSVDVNGTVYSIELNGTGGGSVNINGLGNGTYYVYATYLGDDQYLTNTNDTATFEMTKVNPTGIAILPIADVDYGNVTTITVTVPDGIAGTITLKLNDSTQKTTTLTIVDGKVQWNVTGLAADNYTVYVTYNGNDKYNTQALSDTFEVKGRSWIEHCVRWWNRL